MKNIITLLFVFISLSSSAQEIKEELKLFNRTEVMEFKKSCASLLKLPYGYGTFKEKYSITQNWHGKKEFMYDFYFGICCYRRHYTISREEVIKLIADEEKDIFGLRDIQDRKFKQQRDSLLNIKQ